MSNRAERSGRGGQLGELVGTQRGLQDALDTGTTDDGRHGQADIGQTVSPSLGRTGAPCRNHSR
jgi:hypothetical protein